ncbi:MAG TPA: L,D-transpeptidase [Thermoanaerobaculia bacterium]
MNPRVSFAAAALAALLFAPAVFADQDGRSDNFLLIDGLPSDIPREGTLITIDVSTNQAWLLRDGVAIASSAVASGSDKILRKNGRVWFFRTPRGRMTVQNKIVAPVWTKPDWAFIEEGKKVPPPDSPSRKVAGKLGRYALDLGGGVLIHGTDDPKSIGKYASHGCIRMPAKELAVFYREATVGTPVYIFDSNPKPLSMTGLNSLEMTGLIKESR